MSLLTRKEAAALCGVSQAAFVESYEPMAGEWYRVTAESLRVVLRMVTHGMGDGA